jgi:hypothetical protein
LGQIPQEKHPFPAESAIVVNAGPPCARIAHRFEPGFSVGTVAPVALSGLDERVFFAA